MKQLIAEEAIEIDAPLSVVWELLTDPDKIKKWTLLKIDFNEDSPLEMGSEFYWKDEKGKACARGTVIEFERERMIRTSAYFYHWNRFVDPDALSEIYMVVKKNGKLLLTHTYGDFSLVPGGEEIYRDYIKGVTPENTELKKIKEMAEE
ncbi:MAG: SRPBCC domain-containing protein [Rhizobacter sp.]|nr:SRPBCC domain-containing protein [Ferruginibacter sp.]